MCAVVDSDDEAVLCIGMGSTGVVYNVVEAHVMLSSRFMER